MSIIFSHALNAIKNNAEVPQKIPSHPNLISKTADSSKSILTRIKKFPQKRSFPKEIILSNISQPNLFKISHKLIKKPKRSIAIAKRIPITTNENKAWVHDLYEGPEKNLANPYHKVFIRNLPEIADSEVLKRHISENLRQFLMGIKIEKDTAEINFSNEDAAKKASEALNSKLVAGKKLKAALFSDINLKKNNSLVRKRNFLNNKEMEMEKETENFEKKMSIDQDKKSSIMERIKKNK